MCKSTGILIILVALALSGCRHGVLGKRRSELCCPTDVRKLHRWPYGEDAIFNGPCGTDHDFYGQKPTCWRDWPTSGADWRDGTCGVCVSCNPGAVGEIVISESEYEKMPQIQDPAVVAEPAVEADLPIEKKQPDIRTQSFEQQVTAQERPAVSRQAKPSNRNEVATASNPMRAHKSIEVCGPVAPIAARRPSDHSAGQVVPVAFFEAPRNPSRPNLPAVLSEPPASAIPQPIPPRRLVASNDAKSSSNDTPPRALVVPAARPIRRSP